MQPDSVEVRAKVAGEALGVFAAISLIAFLALLVGQSLLWTGVLPAPGAASTTIVTSPPSTKTTSSSATATAPTPSDGKTSGSETVSGGETRTVVTSPQDSSFLGTLLANPAAFLLLDFLAALFLGFLAGAAWQRARLGRYGFTLGPLALPELTPIDAAATRAVAAPILVEQIPKPVRGALPLGYWWMQIPPDPDMETLKLQRVGLEAGTRQLADRAGIQLIDFTEVVGELLDRVDASARFSAEFGIALVSLVLLGDRVFAGAEIKDDARLALAHANARALKILGRYATGSTRPQSNE